MSFSARKTRSSLPNYSSQWIFQKPKCHFARGRFQTGFPSRLFVNIILINQTTIPHADITTTLWTVTSHASQRWRKHRFTSKLTWHKGHSERPEPGIDSAQKKTDSLNGNVKISQKTCQNACQKFSRLSPVRRIMIIPVVVIVILFHLLLLVVYYILSIHDREQVYDIDQATRHRNRSINPRNNKFDYDLIICCLTVCHF